MSRELELLEKLEKELNLKELQIKSLLTITQAINDNIGGADLYKMYRSFLSWEMGITNMALFIPSEEEGGEGWICATFIDHTEGVGPPNSDQFVPHLLQYKRLHTIKVGDPVCLQDYDIVIPVFHKDKPIAYSVIGGIKTREDLYNKIQFITTITNIIAVAIENKLLFKRQLRQERYKKEMELASNVQQMLIPHMLPSNDQFEVSTIYKPHFNIGGDYLDFIDFDKGRFIFCIADISGKGVAAALLMANFQAMIQSLIFQYRDLETFIFALNQTVFRVTKSDKFITFFVGEVDLHKRTLKYINAGHYPPVLYQNGIINRLTSGCTVIGAFERLPDIQEQTLMLEEGALVMCFTDGLADLTNPAGDLFEDKGIEDFVKDHGHLPVSVFHEELLLRIEEYRQEAPYPDDIAVITCKIKSFD